MAALIDKGDSYHVTYLGAYAIAKSATGVGALQKPLRELYFRHMQPQGPIAGQNRVLVMSGRGLKMSFRTSDHSPPREESFDMPSILFWDAVQFITVRGSDKKKVNGAFEPLNDDRSPNKDKLFSALDKKYHFLQRVNHLPIFTCVLRRTRGVKALDVHAFICSNEVEALGIVQALNRTQEVYKQCEASDSGVFEYKPFSEHQGVQVDATGKVPKVTQLPPRPHNLRQTPQALSLDSKRSQQQKAAAPKPAHSPMHHHDSHPRVFQLTQADFALAPKKPPAPEPPEPIREDQPVRSLRESMSKRKRPALSTPVTAPDPEDSGDDDHVYQYITHIDKTNERKKKGDKKKAPPKNRSPSPNRQNTASVFTSTLSLREVGLDPEGSPPKTGSGGRPKYTSVSKTMDVPEDTSVVSGHQGRPRPHRHSYHNSSAELSRFVDNSRSKSVRARPISPSYDRELPDNTLERQRALQGQGSGHRHGGHDDYERKARPVTVTASSRAFFSSQPDLRGFGVDGGNRGHAPQRPVAMVSPHKIQGVQVLPPTHQGSSPFGSGGNKSNNGSGKRGGDFFKQKSHEITPQKHFETPPRRAKSQVFGGYGTPSNSNERIGKTWQFKESEEIMYQPDTIVQEPPRPPGERTTKVTKGFLQTKDAEIASAFQDLRFNTHNRKEQVPGGTNFEAALGYLP